MKDKILISGFADEISSDFDAQLKTVTELGMQYISLRSADGKGIADYSVEEVRSLILPRLESARVKVSSIGSPIGKVGIADEEGFARFANYSAAVISACSAFLSRRARILKITGTAF